MLITLNTARLTLRPFSAGDLEDLVQLNSDSEVMRYINGGIPLTRENVTEEVLPAFLRWNVSSDRYGFWAAIDRSSGEFLGWFHFRPVRDPSHGDPSDIELGYRLKRSVWGKGYATEGSQILVQTGFEQWNVPRVSASAMKNHLASQQVMKKLGMKLAGTFQEWRWPGRDQTAVLYLLTREDFLSENSPN